MWRITQERTMHDLSLLNPQVNVIDYPHQDYCIANLKKVNADRYERIYDMALSHQIQPVNIRPYTNTDGDVITCSPKLFEFMMKLKATMRNIDFMLPKGLSADPSFPCVIAVVVYRPGDLYALGEIGFYSLNSLAECWGHYRRTLSDPYNPNNSGDVYVVSSPFIKNTRYREDSVGAVCKTSVNLDSAVSNAKKFLRQYSPIDLGYVSQRAIRGAYRAAWEKASSNLRNIESDIKWDNAVRSRVMRAIHSIATEHTTKIMDSDVIRLAMDFVAAEDICIKLDKQQITATFVTMSRISGLITVPFFTVNQDRPMRATDTPTVYKTLEVVPEDLLGAIATLDMLANGEFLEGVGVKVTENAYWVHRNE